MILLPVVFLAFAIQTGWNFRVYRQNDKTLVPALRTVKKVFICPLAQADQIRAGSFGLGMAENFCQGDTLFFFVAEAHITRLSAHATKLADGVYAVNSGYYFYLFRRHFWNISALQIRLYPMPAEKYERKKTEKIQR